MRPPVPATTMNPLTRCLGVACATAGLLPGQTTSQRVVDPPVRGFRVWPSTPPPDCPFPQSKDLTGILFTSVHSDYRCGDTFYPSWAADGNLYSPWTDGKTDGVSASSGGEGAVTGNAVLLGDNPLRLTIRNTSAPQPASPLPYRGRYPCGSLVHDGVWYYGTYCLGPYGMVQHDGFTWNWPVLGPMPGFRISTDFGRTWTPSPLSPGKPLFPEPAEHLGPVKLGCPHFVDFGRNMQHSPDGKAYLVGTGATADDPRPRYANLSWITGDQIYLARVSPSPATINDLSRYEFFAGRGPDGGTQAVEVGFAPKTVTWVRFTVTAVKAGSPNVGLTEMAMFE